MCTRPIEKDGNIFACRTCDDCIATRRHGWVARAMAEKADHSHAACIALTYSDETQEGRDGARMFAYHDVRGFMHRLRRAARYEAEKGNWNIVPQVRFICAGEQGDRNGRCHWHLIIYSNFDLARIGQFRLRGKLVSHRRDMISVGKRKRRLNWSLWPLGFMTLQEPDEGAMHYVLSYCLKDQFTQEKSRFTMREAQSENFATGLFRMSKRPAIGENFLMRKMEALDATHSVLPSLNLKVPGLSGYWQPNGSFRKKLLWCLVALKQRAVWATGALPPQWSSLLSACADNQSDMELLNGPSPEETDYTEVARKVGRRLESWAEVRSDRAARAERGPCCCRACLDSATERELAERGLWRVVASKGRESAYYRDASCTFGTEAHVWLTCKYEPDGP